MSLLVAYACLREEFLFGFTSYLCLFAVVIETAWCISHQMA